MSFGMHMAVGIKLFKSTGVHWQAPIQVFSALFKMHSSTVWVEGRAPWEWQYPVGITGLVLTPVPLYQVHLFMQSDSISTSTQVLNSVSLLVIKLGAQKSFPGISSLAEDQMQPEAAALPSQACLSAYGRQIVALSSHSSTETGWQKFLENNGPVISP